MPEGPNMVDVHIPFLLADQIYSQPNFELSFGGRGPETCGRPEIQFVHKRYDTNNFLGC